MASPAGAPPTAPRRRRSLLMLALLVLVLVVLLLLGLTQCGNDDANTATSDAGSSAATTPTTTPSTPSSSPSDDSASASTGTQGSPGALTIGSTALLSGTTAGGSADVADLTRYSGQQATATAVTVESVPADEGFWIGSSDTQRIWVQLTGSGESPFTVKAGQKATFTGRVTAHDAGFPTKVGVTTAEGADQLVAQKQHVQVERSAVKIAD